MKLSLSKYGWKCVLGAEISYILCVLGGYLSLRNEKATELHRSLFEIFPGFVWGQWLSLAIGALYVFVFAWIFAVYMVWMFNTSLESK